MYSVYEKCLKKTSWVLKKNVIKHGYKLATTTCKKQKTTTCVFFCSGIGGTGRTREE